VSGPQFANQPTGTVLAIGRPETDGEDFVTVRVKAGGVTDELRFSPRELAAVGRSAGAPRSGHEARPPRARAAEQAGQTESAPRENSKAAPPGAAPAKKAAPAKRAVPPGNAPSPAKATVAAPNRRRGASLPRVSVTLTSAGATWSVSAQRGARTVVKSAPLPPGVVSAVAELLGLPAVSDAVAAVNDAALKEAEARAATLRAELAALEAELDSHRRPEQR
jgi:hypothetical protein